MKISICKTSAFILLLSIFTLSSAGSTEIRKTFSWKYSINKDAKVTMDNYDCNLSIHTWDKAETEFRLIVDAETSSDEDAKILEEYLNNLVFSNTPSSAAFRSRFWENRNTVQFINLKRISMKLGNGKSVTLSSFMIEGELWIPSTCRFGLDSKYSQITMEDFAGPLKLNLYNDNFTGGKVSADLEINDKYSTIDIGDVKNIRADLYNSKLTAGNTGDIDIRSKYSRISLRSCGKLSSDSYNDKYEIPRTGDIMFTAKYSDLKTEISEDITINLYNGNLKLGEAGNLKITSKYGVYDISSAGICSISSTYNDRLTAGKLSSLTVVQSKYTSFIIGKLTESIEDRDGYSDTFIVSETGSSFSGLYLNGKYLKASLTIPHNASYRFKASIKYPELDINEQTFKPIVKIIDGSDVKYDAIKGKESEGMPVIEVNGYSMTLKIVEK